MTETHVASLLPKQKDWKLVWNDEFDGVELDTTKWSYRLHLMHERHIPFAENGVILDGNSNLMLPLIERDGHFFSPHLQTGANFMDLPAEGYDTTKFKWPVGKLPEHKFLHKYGYYECRCKLPVQKGWGAAFWLQSPIIGATLDPKFSGVEADIMENWSPGHSLSNRFISHNNHWNGYGPDHKTLCSGDRELKETADGFHVFGLDWSRDGYTYYIDGEESWHVDGPVSNSEQFILISTECSGYRVSDKPSEDLLEAKLPDYFIIDYVRVYDEV